MNAASCLSATKDKLAPVLTLCLNETADGFQKPFAVSLADERNRQPVKVLKECFMASTKTSPLARTLKQNRPFASLQQEAFLSILRTASELSYTADKSLREFGITQPQYNVLRILRGAGAEGLCRNEISSRMVTATPDMSRLLDRMERSGWITRKRSEDDKRQVSTFITESGEKLLTTIDAPTGDQTNQMFKGIKSGDLKFLLDILTEIRNRNSEPD